MKKSLDHIHLTGYKSIQNMDLDLRSLNILIGANGAGKTNFMSLFTLLRNIMNNKLGLYVGKEGGANRLLHFGRKNTEQIEIKLTFEEDNYSCKLVPAARDTLVFVKEEGNFRDGPHSELRKFQSLVGGGKETNVFKNEEKLTTETAKTMIQTMRSWWIYHFHDTSSSAKVKQTSDLNDNAFLRPDAGNLAPFLYRLQETEPQSYRRIVAAIQQMAPFFDDFFLRPDPLNPKKILLEWIEKESDDNFSVDYFSDGTLRFICLATLLLQTTLPSLILIDEPELGLHPSAIVLLASLLRKAATRTQLIVSTQSVPLINQFPPEDIIVVDRNGITSSFRRLETASLENWLEEYSLGELWEKNVLGGRPR